MASLHQPLHPEPPFSNLRILTFNTFLRPPLIKNNKSDYKDLRADYIAENVLQHYDILCLQEVFQLFNTRRQRITNAAQRVGLSYIAESPSPDFWSTRLLDAGLVILSRFPIIAHEFRPFKGGVFPDLLAKKGILYAKILVDGQTVHVFNTHAQASYPTKNFKKWMLERQARVNHIRQIREFILEKTQNKQELVLIMGDFNVDGNDPGHKFFPEAELEDCYDELINVLSDNGSYPIYDIIRTKYGYSPATYGRVDEFGNPLETELTHPRDYTVEFSIDYIFVFNNSFGNFSVDQEESRLEEFKVEGYPFKYLSDHCGVQTVIQSKSL